MIAPRPACWKNNVGENWRSARGADLDVGELCKLCDFDAESAADLDRPLGHLVVASSSRWKTIHLHEAHGDAQSPDGGTSAERSLHDQIADPETGPADVGLSPLSGGSD